MIKQKQKSSSPGVRRWEDLSLDILKQIFNGVPVSDLSQNVSSVCHSWQLGCWHVLCWANNVLDLSVTKAFLDAVKSTAAKLLKANGRSCPIDKYAKALMDKKLMELLKSILEDDDEYGIYLKPWRLSIQTVTIPETIQLSDMHLFYIAERTTGLENLDLLGSSRITGRGFAIAICHWKNVKAIYLGNVRSECFTQIIEEIGKNCSMLEQISLSMYDFRINHDNAHVMVKNLRQVKTLRFEDASVYRDGMEVLFNYTVRVKTIQLRRCLLKGYHDSNFVEFLYSLPLSISFTLRGWKWHNSISGKAPAEFEWNEWMNNENYGLY